MDAARFSRESERSWLQPLTAFNEVCSDLPKFSKLTIQCEGNWFPRLVDKQMFSDMSRRSAVEATYP